MTAAAQGTPDESSWRGRLGAALQSAAFVVLLACVASRCFLAELPFRSSAVRTAPAGPNSAQGHVTAAPTDRGELARVSFAVVLLAAWALWLHGAVLAGRLRFRHGTLALLVILFAAWSLAAALYASDKRSALDSWIEQVSLLAAGVLAVQMCSDRRRFALLVIVLAGLAGAMAIKGIYQVAVEVPERVRDFELYRAERLAQFGWAEGTPQAKLIASRMRDTAPFGFFGLANLFGSLMILLTAAAGGLAMAKIIAAVRAGKPAAQRKRGEIDLPTLASILTAILAVAAAVVLLLTRSRGAIGGVVVAGALGAAVYLLLRRLSRRWRTCVLVGALVFLLGAAGVVAYGCVRDRLPTKTMTFRWYYWTASARIVRGSPLLGVGPGNFPSAYLRHRRAAAEEEVKMPHNALVHAATQYGLPGAALYLAILAYMLIGATRPGRFSEAGEDSSYDRRDRPWRRWQVLLILAIVTASVLVARAIFADLDDPVLLIFEGVLPAAALAVCLLLAAWMAGLSGSAMMQRESLVRVVLICGLFGFLLHNMVTFSLWAPAAALVFWTAVGACLARAGGGEPRALNVLVGRAAGTGAVVAVAVVLAFLWSPALLRTYFTEMMLGSLSRGRLSVAAVQAGTAAAIDERDAIAAADAARLSLAEAAADPRNEFLLITAYDWAKQAIERDPARWTYRSLAARIAMQFAEANVPEGPTYQSALAHMANAVELNPNDARLRLAYARMSTAAGRREQCLAQLRTAEAIEAQLFGESVEKFNPAERREIEKLRREAQR